MTAYKIGDFVEYVPMLDEAIAVPLVPQRWYVLLTFANKERKVMRTFRERGVSAYFPMIRKRAVHRGRICEIAAPLFAGVIFIPDFQAGLGSVKVDGVEGYFKMGECYPYLTPKLMQDVRTLEAMGSIPLARRKRLWSVGQLVRVTDGPFASFQGTIDRLDSRGRLGVLVDIFKRATPVTLDERQIEPA
ncbi:transcription termination/antitermination NusG family protein [Bradyrhizobium ottawaense]|uniref:transcription termination/antitermination protein NusG n=1 Tax=Bradyrhizobium ottawaense TaxID=931866 RepID=UPI0027144D05|nr:transcription termination/antitermination NusG family protein [Bradyrhizobium ottawaense]WLB43034.1 transcription termination/antitermination NusG family protein [Bradyrhizobium ottawaense]